MQNSMKITYIFLIICTKLYNVVTTCELLVIMKIIFWF